jgi:hypothetical protein
LSFWNYRLEVHSLDGALLAILENVVAPSLQQAANEAPLLVFYLPSDDDKLAHVLPAPEIWVRDAGTGEVIAKTRLTKREDIRT